MLRTLRKFFDAYRGSFSSFVWGIAMRYFQESTSLSFSNFDWPNHFVHVVLFPRFSKLKDHDGNPSTAFRVRSGTMRCFDDLADDTRAALAFSPAEVQELKAEYQNFPVTSRNDCYGLLLLVLDIGEGRQTRHYVPIWSYILRDAARSLHPDAPTGFDILQTLADRGLEVRMNKERRENCIHRMDKVDGEWNWRPLERSEEVELRSQSDEALRRVFHWAMTRVRIID